MALRDKAPYEQSRAALRQLYGSRKIDASAPQSARDGTPSGRAKRLTELGYSDAQAATGVANQFQAMFGKYPQTTANPTPMGQGAASAFPATPNTGFTAANPSQALVPVSGLTPSQPSASTFTPLSFNLNTTSPLGASALAPFMPTQPQAYTPPWKKQQTPYMGSIYQSASRWLS